ncbi:hypothetical protein, partial [Aeromonas sp. QDB48]|uniref:hypothetical protein n=1 Tax=Aeromonas sp. QDB48 TaxID=2990492 RepID=UPI0022E093A8
GDVSALRIRVFTLAGMAVQLRRNTHLALIWPDYTQIVASEQDFIVALAHKCELYHVPQVRKSVEDCLRRAANDPTTKIPRSIDRESAPALFEALLVEEGVPPNM